MIRMNNRIILLGILIISFYLQSCGVYRTNNRGKIIVYSVNDAQNKIKSNKFDTIVLKDGIYRDILFKFPEESSNIILTSQTPGGAIITGKSKIFLSGKKEYSTG